MLEKSDNLFASNDFLNRCLQFFHRNFKLLRPWRRYDFQCALSLPGNYMMYRGWERVKKQRSIPSIGGDAEG